MTKRAFVYDLEQFEPHHMAQVAEIAKLYADTTADTIPMWEHREVRFVYLTDLDKVFLINCYKELVTLREDTNQLEMWHALPCYGNEGYIDDLARQAIDDWIHRSHGEDEDIEYIWVALHRTYPNARITSEFDGIFHVSDDLVAEIF